VEELERDLLRAIAAHGDDGVDAKLLGVGNDLVGNVANNLLTVLHCVVLKGVAAVGGPEDGAAAGPDPADAFEREFDRALGPDQPVEAIGNADDFPVIFENGRLEDGADDRVEPGRVATPGPDANATYVRHVTRLMGAPEL